MLTVFLSIITCTLFTVTPASFATSLTYYNLLQVVFRGTPYVCLCVVCLCNNCSSSSNTTARVRVFVCVLLGFSWPRGATFNDLFATNKLLRAAYLCVCLQLVYTKGTSGTRHVEFFSFNNLGHKNDIKNSPSVWLTTHT